MLSYFKREGTEHSHNLNQTKPNFRSVNDSVSNSLELTPGGVALFPGSALCSTQSLSSRLWLAPFHYCYCSWWSSHSTGISKTAVLPSCTWTALSPTAPPGLSAEPSHTVPSLSCSPQTLHTFKISTTRVTLTLQSSAVNTRYNSGYA